MLQANKCSEANESSSTRMYNKILASEALGGSGVGGDMFCINAFNRWLRSYPFKHQKFYF